MESYQSVVIPNPSIVAKSPKLKPDSLPLNSNRLSRENGVHGKETEVGNSEFVGSLEVYIYQARDIHNICIYHKQDVYAKLSLTSDPETVVSTQIIKGGGKNPVFNENLRLNVRTLDSSLKCEIWMLSRIKNYLEDQLLGFTLVPLSDVLIRNGNLAQEFSLCSNDLCGSSSGFVQLTLTYSGALPEVLEIPRLGSSLIATAAPLDSEIPTSIPDEFDKIEFPDPKILNENAMMVSEYFGIPCANLDSGRAENLSITENDNHLSSEEIGVHLVESFSTASLDAVELSKSLNQDAGSSTKEKVEDAECGFSVLVNTCPQPFTNVNIEAEQKVVQQEIIDMYKKSMQQFTESLAKMNLPMNIENKSANSGTSRSGEKVSASKGNGPNSRVFYGSRAFF